jgi:hypothetical protein
MASDFISENDLNTFDGYLRLQAIDPSTAGLEVLAMYRNHSTRRWQSGLQRPNLGR